ncbi:MAG TPA: helix-turn-helix transcriptional regulator [Prosthecobacter sp.]|nr:helix-turn-helix transcriptional regulator [Prosthecobacter sp.]
MRNNIPTQIQDFECIGALSEAQMEVFLDLGCGMTAREIAAKRHIARHTAETHISNVKVKLDLPSTGVVRTYAAAFLALQKRLGWQVDWCPVRPHFSLREAA